MTLDVDPFEAFEEANAQGARDPYPEWASMLAQSPVHEIDLRVLEQRIRLVAATDDQGLPFFQIKEASLIGTGNDKQLTKHGFSCARAERSSYPDRYGDRLLVNRRS